MESGQLLDIHQHLTETLDVRLRDIDVLSTASRVASRRRGRHNAAMKTTLALAISLCVPVSRDSWAEETEVLFGGTAVEGWDPARDQDRLKREFEVSELPAVKSPPGRLDTAGIRVRMDGALGRCTATGGVTFPNGAIRFRRPRLRRHTQRGPNAES